MLWKKRWPRRMLTKAVLALAEKTLKETIEGVRAGTRDLHRDLQIDPASDDDVDLLEIGFGDLLRRHKVRDLGGRREVEKQIAQLQEAERKGTKLSPRYFIFDRDGVPTGLTNSQAIKILQWDRRCLENYLIDFDVLTDLLLLEFSAQVPYFVFHAYYERGNLPLS